MNLILSNSLFNCYQLVILRQCYIIHRLFHVASISIFWLLVLNGKSLAQTNLNDKQHRDAQPDLGELLPVPEPPIINKDQKKSQITPPLSIAAEPEFQSVLQTPGGDLKQLESSLIKQQTSEKIPETTASTSITSILKRTRLPQLAAGRGIADLGLEPMRMSNNPLDASWQQQDTLNAQATPLVSQSSTAITQEFTAPAASLHSQSQVAPLPPLPDITGDTISTPPPVSTTSAPTFNQQLYSQAATPQSVPNTLGQSFTLQLTCQLAAPPSVPSTPGQSFNVLLTCQAATPLSLPSTNPLTYNQPPNSQAVTPPSVTSSTGETQSTLAPIAPVPRDAIPPVAPPPPLQQLPLLNNTALREPFLHFQGVYVTQGSDTSARARLTGVYPLTPQALFGATLDLTNRGNLFTDSRGEGLNINELDFATSLASLPNLRFVIGQLDLTSYFDRNSFAKDGASQFFNPVFQTNPALAATGIASRTGLLVNWSVNDNIEAKAAVFSSANKISDFTLDGFAGEIGVRFGNAIIRGTYATDRDAGVRDTFPEAFSIPRNAARTAFGILPNDREEAYGLNTEVFIPNLKLGLFGRYGRYEDRDLSKGADLYSFGATLLDLFINNDRLGLAYGRALSNEKLHRGNPLDVMELYYDFPFLSNLWLGFTFQERNSFNEAVLGVRVRSDFDILPRGRNAR